MKLKMNKDVCMFPNKKRKNYIKKISNINSCDKIIFCLLKNNLFLVSYKANGTQITLKKLNTV